jgi:hypothetical protein
MISIFANKTHFTAAFGRKAVGLFALISLGLSGMMFSIGGQDLSKDDAGGETSVGTIFTNTTPITISTGPANNGVPYPSTIAVSGVTGTIPSTPGSLKVTLNNFSHTFPDDMGLVLVGPTGAALLLQDGAGDNPDITGVTYTLSDDGAAQLPNLTAWTAGTYKPTGFYAGDSFPAPGPLTVYSHPGPAGGGTATFTSVFGGTNPNGNWNLYVRDFATGDGGSFAGGWSLEINTGTAAPPQNVVDFNGDGRTDFGVVRNVGGGPSGQVRWFYYENNTANPTRAFDWGIATDLFTPVDFDGDNLTDIAVWRPGSASSVGPGLAQFFILQSQTSTVRIVSFGQTNDDPTVVGDYDGDGKADPAVYRAGASAGQQSTWYYLGSLNNPSNNVTYVPWGLNGDFPAPGDYDGDGRSDFVVQRNNGGGQARFWMLQTTAGFESVVFGTPTDPIVPGDYDADGKTDIAVVRGISGAWNWFVRPSSTGTISAAPFAVFGSSTTDFPTQGDYDGDGKTDAAVWRPSASAGASAFWALGSTSGAFSVPFGQNGDYPVANYNVH